MPGTLLGTQEMEKTSYTPCLQGIHNLIGGTNHINKYVLNEKERKRQRQRDRFFKIKKYPKKPYGYQEVSGGKG